MSKPRVLRCVATDAPIDYRGYGRPQKYLNENVKRKADVERRRERRRLAAVERKRGAL